MARAQKRPSGTAPLAALLGADRFRLGPKSGRVAGNLAAHGGISDERAPAWIGADLPPLGAPSVTLGPARGTLGPFSFGFLDNHRGVAAYAGALVTRPRAGSIAIVCGRRDALPEVAPLAVARRLGVSWIISVGEGDAGEVLAFLADDPRTAAVLLAAHAEPGAIAALGEKGLVVLGGDPLTRAAARRRGGAAVDDLEEWLAHGALLAAGSAAALARPRAIVVGGGGAVLADAARAAGLQLPLLTVGDDDPDELSAVLAEAGGDDLLLLAGCDATPAAPHVPVDLGHAESVRALCRALVERATPPPAPIQRVRADREQAEAILADAGPELTDHDTKRILKQYGVTVSRQAPAPSATRAAQIGTQIGFPVDLVAGPSLRRASTVAELRRYAAVALGPLPFVVVRQAFPDAPRARFSVKRQRGLGLVAEVGTERALLPLERDDAIVLSRAAAGEVERALVDLLARATACAVELDLTLDLELYVGDSPAVISAAAKSTK